MNRSKRKISIIITLVMVLTCFMSACGSQPNNVTTAEPSATVAATAAPAASGTPAAKPEEADPSTWISDTLVEITLMREENASQALRTDSIKNLYLEELLNVRFVIEAVAAASYAEKKQILIATDDMTDIVKVDLNDIRTYSRQGLFVNLTENADKLDNFFEIFGAQPSLAMGNVDGNTYGFPIIRRLSENDSIGGQLPVIRMDLIDQYNLKIPTTYDELFDVLTVFKEYNPDKIMLTNRKGGSTTATQKVLDCMAYSLGSGSTMYYDEDLGGVWVYGPAHENFKEVLSYLNKLYAAGLMDRDYATNTVDLWKEKMSSGRALMYFDNAGFADDFNMALQTIEPNAKLQVISTMTNSLGQTRNFIYDNNWPDQIYVISDSSPVIDICLKFFNWAYSDAGCDINSYGIEGETFEYVNGLPRLTEEIKAKYAASGSNSPSYDLQADVGLGLLAFSPYLDIGAGVQMSNYMLSEEALSDQETDRLARLSDGGLRSPISDPPLDEDATERYNRLYTGVSNLVAQEWDKYIMGVEPIENYDNVIAAAREAGATEMEQIYNDAWKAALGK